MTHACVSGRFPGSKVWMFSEWEPCFDVATAFIYWVLPTTCFANPLIFATYFHDGCMVLYHVVSVLTWAPRYGPSRVNTHGWIMVELDKIGQESTKKRWNNCAAEVTAVYDKAFSKSWGTGSASARQMDANGAEILRGDIGYYWMILEPAIGPRSQCVRASSIFLRL